jgi:phage-related protein
MGQSYFIWNGIDCRSMGVTMRGPAAIIRAEERVKHVEIPGRSGDLTETEGEHIYNSYIQTVSISVKGGYRVREVYKWLRGAGYVTFSGEPGKKQAARIIGAVTLNRISRNMDRWAGEVQFYCQPMKERLHDEKQTVTVSGTVVSNDGDVECYPLIKAVPSLSLLGIAVGDKPGLIITGLTTGSEIWIDSGTMEIWNADRSATITEKSSGNFPVLQPGGNVITFAGISSMEIDKRERFL